MLLCEKTAGDHVGELTGSMLAAALTAGILTVVMTAIGGKSMDDSANPLAGPAWSDGWHPGVPLDYVTNLHVTSDTFVPTEMTPLVDEVTAPIELGAKISVFATSTGGANASGAHLVHRNLEVDLGHALANEAAMEEVSLRSEDFKLGIKAFAARQPVEFTGR